MCGERRGRGMALRVNLRSAAITRRRARRALHPVRGVRYGAAMAYAQWRKRRLKRKSSEPGVEQIGIEAYRSGEGGRRAWRS